MKFSFALLAIAASLAVIFCQETDEIPTDGQPIPEEVTTPVIETTTVIDVRKQCEEAVKSCFMEQGFMGMFNREAIKRCVDAKPITRCARPMFNQIFKRFRDMFGGFFGNNQGFGQ